LKWKSAQTFVAADTDIRFYVDCSRANVWGAWKAMRYNEILDERHYKSTSLSRKERQICSF